MNALANGRMQDGENSSPDSEVAPQIDRDRIGPVSKQVEGADQKRCAEQHQRRIGRGKAGPAQEQEANGPKAGFVTKNAVSEFVNHLESVFFSLKANKKRK